MAKFIAAQFRKESQFCYKAIDCPRLLIVLISAKRETLSIR